MRRRLRILIVLASTFAMVMVLNVGTAFAENAGDPVDWTCISTEDTTMGECTQWETEGIAAQNAIGPVLFNTPATVAGRFVGIDRNPLCLLHDFADFPPEPEL